MSVADLALQRNKYKHLSDDEWRWFLQQVEGKERTAEKLPTFASIPDWWYPVRLSCEQCSSELAARYKASLVSGEKMADLTGGYGVDTYFLSENFTHTDYVEQNAELCRIATHNFAHKPITIHNTSAEEFLVSAGQYDLIFLDPARRDSHGGKVFRLEDCTPNIVELLPTLLAHSKRVLLKLSPMLDLTQAIHALSAVTWDIYVVAIKNEVKELLLVSGGSGQITAIDLDKKDQAFTFTREEESNSPFNFHLSPFTFLYEPSAAILKAGAYKLIAERFHLLKLDVNTHLYASDTLIPNFPGRVWKIIEKQDLKQANVLCRNYPLTPEALKKKLHLRDGGTAFVIGCRVAGKPTLFFAERV
ncbi:MAG: SAM-dependent methyltransferase [Paludibacteraceae bacterium]|nr:SAM-dependent methyltransferase [Paludibacteraceae bacterium]